jgi:drug/metabolite transporter (DMT)-like permease
MLGIGLAALGVLLVVTQGDLQQLGRGQIGTWGDLLILISAPNWAVFSVLSRRGLRTYPATLLIFYVMGFGWLFTSILFFSGPGLDQIAQLTRTGWLAITFLGVACSGLAYLFWYDALDNLPIAQAGSFVYFEPFITVLLAALLLNEPLLWSSLAGGGMILLGVILVQKVRKR